MLALVALLASPPVDSDAATIGRSSRHSAVPAGVPPIGVMDAPAVDLSIVAGQMVVLLASASDPDGPLPLGYQWDLGGAAANSTLEDPGPVKFDVPGVFTITLRVRDAAGNVDPDPPTRVVTVTSAASLPADEIHWTPTGPTSVTFDWRGAPTTIAYGTTTAYGQTAIAQSPSPMPYSSAGPFREARITGLAPNTLYHYSIGGGPDHTFRTPPPRGKSGFTAIVFGDIGSSLNYSTVPPMQALLAWQRPELAFMVGDLTYGDDKGPAAVDRHFNDVMVWSQDVPYLPAWGNHEWGSTVDDLRNYKGRFDLPNPRASPGAPASGCCGEDWYWFDYGNVRFIAYPEPYVGTTWTEWYPRADSLMNAVRNDAQIRFIVTFGHRPAYSSGHHSGDAALRARLDSLGVRHPKYVLNVNGHSHDYERSHPQRGVIHVTSGGGGASLERASGPCPWDGGCPPPAWSAFRALHHGALRLRFSTGGIVGEAICGPSSADQDMSCAFGTVFDQFVIGVPDMEPVVTAPAALAGSEGTLVTLTVGVSDPDDQPIDALTADLSSLPPGHDAVFTPSPDRTSGTLTWTPSHSDAGTYVVGFRATNSLAGVASTTITIANVDRAPGLTVSGALAVNEMSQVSLSVGASDPDGDPIDELTVDLSSLPAGNDAAFAVAPDRTSATLTWTPTFADSGRYPLTFRARNALTGVAAPTIAVIHVDRPPIVAAPAVAPASEGATMTVAITATDPDGDAIISLTADLASLPTGHGATFTPAAGNGSATLSWTPSFTAGPASYPVHFLATNASGGSATTVIEVANVDRPPIVLAPATVAASEGAPVTVTVTASDPDGDAITALSADLASLPAGHGAVFTPAAGNASGTFTWTPSFTAGPAGYAIQFMASNALGGSDTTLVQVANVDRAPIVTAPAIANASEGSLVTVTVTATDPDGDPIASLTADLSSLPEGHGATFVPGAGNTSGTLTWTPSFTASGSHSVRFQVANALGGSDTTIVQVANVDRPPVVSAPTTVVAAEGTPVTVTIAASDPDGNAIASITADLSGLPPGHGASFVPHSGNRGGSLTWTPAFTAGPGSYAVRFTATNALAGADTTILQVTNVDRPPVVSSPTTASATEGTAVTVAVTASDPDGDPIGALSADLSSLPAGNGAVFTPATGNTSGTLTWTPSFTAGPGSYAVRFFATNALGGTDTTIVQVANLDRAPVVVSPATVSAAEGVPLNVTVTVSDPDGDAIAALTADLSSLPAGHNAVFTPAAGNASGTLTWTPSYAAAGTYAVRFSGTNALGGVDTTIVQVTNVDRAPVVVSPITVPVTEGVTVSVGVHAFDPDGDAIAALNADLSTLPVGHDAVFAPAAGNASGTLTWTPSFASGPGNYAVRFTASNALGGADTTVLQVANVDRGPVVVSPATVSATEGVAVSVTVTVWDPDGDAIDALTADLSSLPPGHGAVFMPATGNTSGTLTWTPSFASGPGNYAVRFTASNALGGADTTVLQVANVDRGPVVVSPATVSATEGVAVSVTVTVADPDGDAIDALTADLSSLPAGHGATFVAAAGNTSGTLTWTPSFASGPGSYAVRFTATNALGGADTTMLQVTNVDRPPIVSAPATVNGSESVTLSVPITASDPDGDAITALTADLTSLPAGHGAVFTPATGNGSGTLTWRPSYTSGTNSYPVTFRATNALGGTSTTTIQVANVDRVPIVSAPPFATASEGTPTTIQVSAADPDGEPIASLVADLSSLPAGHGATFVAATGNTSGTFSWTPPFTTGANVYSVTFTATNALGGSATSMIQVSNVDRAPVIGAPATLAASEGAPISLAVTVTDPDGEAITTLTANLAGLPAGHDAVFVPGSGNGSGTLTWTPSYAAGPGSYSVVFQASNALAVSKTTTIQVANLDRPPIVTAPPYASAVERSLASFQVSASDPDGEPIASLVADLSSLPAGHDATFVAAAGNTSGTFSWTPPSNVGPNSFSITFTATNALGGSATSILQVSNHDRAPIVGAPASLTANEGAPISVAVTATDPDGEPITSLTASLAGLPAGHNAVFVPASGNGSGTLTWTPSYATAPGSYSVVFQATNDLTATATTTIQVANVDRAPIVTAPASTAASEGSRLTVAVAALDPDGDGIATLTADFSSLPGGHGASFVPAAGNGSGTFTWTPAYHHAPGNYSVRFHATNALSSSFRTTILVGNVDRPPVVVAPTAVAASEGTPVTVGVTAGDPDGEGITSLVADVSSLPAGHNAVFVPAAGNGSGTLTWTPSFASGPGSYAIRFEATNALGGSDTTAIQVTHVDRAPLVNAPATATAHEGATLTLAVSASDPDGDAIGALTADLSALPAGHGATFAPAPGNGGGTLTWTPSFSAAGNYTIAFRASNALTGPAVSSTIQVNAVDRPPAITVPATTIAAEGQTITIDIGVADPDGDAIAALSADLSSLPAGHDASFTPASGNGAGTLRWTPTFADAGGPYTVSFTASNALAASRAVAITVTAVDRPPALAVPAGVTGAAGGTIAFVVGASDPDGDPLAALTADLSDLPAGHDARFVAGEGNTSGAFTWTPAASDTGTYSVSFSATNALAGASVTTLTVGPNRRPLAALEMTPTSGIEPLIVTASALTSSDPDGPIASYRFDFGDGTVLGPQSSPTAVHTYAAGTWVARVVVTDQAGGVDSVESIVSALPNLAANSSFESSMVGWNAYAGSTIARVAGGVHGSWSLEVTGPASLATYGVNDSPDLISRTAQAGWIYRYRAWVRAEGAAGRARLQLREYLNSVQQGPTILTPLVSLTPQWQVLSVDYEALTSGSSLNFQVLAIPTAPGQKFQTDYLSLTAGHPLAGIDPDPAPLRFGARLYPNPSRGRVTLALTLTREGPVTIRVLDLAGREVRRAREELALPAGTHDVPLLFGRTAPLSTGVYFYRVETAEGERSGRFVVLQ